MKAPEKILFLLKYFRLKWEDLIYIKGDFWEGGNFQSSYLNLTEIKP